MNQAELHGKRDLILGGGFFDADFYKEKYCLSVSDPNELAVHYIENYGECHETSILFSGKAYYELNPDVARTGINPLLHYMQFGLKEGRRSIPEERAAAAFEAADVGAALPIDAIVPAGRKVRVLFTASGNFFFQDIAEYVARALTELGWETALMSDQNPRESEKGWFDLVVAPHEYMIIGRGRLWSGQRSRDAAYFNTEQWQTTWFAACLGHLRGSRHGVIDLNPTSAAAFATLGVRAAFLPLLPLPGTAFAQHRATFTKSFARRKYVETLRYPDAILDRQYDLLFVANLNARRQAVLADLAPTLARFKSFIHCPVMDTPVRPGDGDMLSGRDFTQLALNTKILLNIHRDEIGYFEWHRLFLYGIANGTVVLTEPSFHVPALVPGTHYIETPAADMPSVISHLLSTSEGRERLQSVSAACRLLLSQVSLDSLVRT